MELYFHSFTDFTGVIRRHRINPNNNNSNNDDDDDDDDNNNK